MGQGGSGVNSPSGAGNAGGMRMSYGGNATGTGANLQLYIYNGVGTARPSFGTAANSLPYDAWHHCVGTFDGTTAILYIDGQPQITNSPMTMAPDTWSPLTIGDAFWQGMGPIRSFYGSIDEVAVYTNVLSADRVLEHFTAANNYTSSNYVQAVQADSPLLYYRMDAPGYVAPNANLNPTAVNFGSVAANGGVYQGGVMPGAIPGPSIVGLNSSVAAPINGVISCIDAGNDPAFNATGTQPFSAMVWFKGYPCDGRVQSLMSHGTNWALFVDGTTGYLVFTPNNTTSLTTTNIFNDGSWHMAVGVFDGTTGYLYVDGLLKVSQAAAGSVAGDPNAEVFLGGNADYTTINVNQRYLDGALAQAAFFTNALTGTQIANLYIAAVPSPTISLGYSGGHLVITYTGTLVSSTTVNGTYSPVSGASSPYQVPQTDPQRFYRARVP